MLTLCLALLLPDASPADLGRFPDRAACDDAKAALRRYAEWCEERAAAEPFDVQRAPWRERIEWAAWAYRVWDKLDDCYAFEDPLPHLRSLRRMLGAADYLAGRMPCRPP